MLGRLDQLLGRHMGDLDTRIAELGDLRDEIQNYRDHVRSRADALAANGSRPGQRSPA